MSVAVAVLVVSWTDDENVRRRMRYVDITFWINGFSLLALVVVYLGEAASIPGFNSGRAAQTFNTT